MTRRPFEFNGVVRLTKIGGAYVVATLLIGFAALNTGNNALYIALSFLLAAMILSGIASKGGLKHLRVRFAGAEETWAGRAALGTLVIENDSPIWDVRDLIVTASTMTAPLLVATVPKHSSIHSDMELLFARRGRVRLEQVDLYTRYPFGLFLKKRKVRIEGETIVYPRLLEGTGGRARRLAELGDVAAVNRQGSGSEIYGFREYVHGDSLRQVHWKKSASLGRWITKQYLSEGGDRVVVVVDPVLPAGTDPERFEELISAATTMLREAVEERKEVILRISGETWSTSADPSARSLFEALALVESRPSGPIPPTGRDAFVFTLRGIDEARSA